MGGVRPWISWAMRRRAEHYMAETAHFAAVASRTLEQMLALNGKTDYGRQHGLDGADARRAFERLPATTYADYASYIERTAAGELNTMSGEPVIYFSTSSGTTGPPKLIPVTRRQMRMAVGTRLTSMGLAIRAGVLGPMHGRFMTIMSEHMTGRTSGGLPTGAATSGGFRQLSQVMDLILTSPGEVIGVRDQAAARYLHLLFGLREEWLWAMVAFFPATILFALRDLQARAPELLRDLADGTVSPALDIPAETRARLLRRLRPERTRARALDALLERGEFTVPNIWPDLGAVLTATGGAFGFYADQMRPLLGDVSVFSPVYSASEGTMGYGFSADNPYYLVLPTLLYVEFLPVEEMDDPQARPIPAWQAKPGCCYEVVVTTLAGFTRYRLHDVVKVVDFCGQTPVIEFVERRGQVIEIVGEKTAEHHIVAAVEAACREVKTPLVDYLVTPDTSRAPPRYLLAAEGWRDNAAETGEARAFLQAVDAALCRTSVFYGEERELGSLACMTLALLKPGAFERYRERRVAAGASASQVKTPHVVPDPQFFDREFRGEVLARIEVSDGGARETTST